MQFVAVLRATNVADNGSAKPSERRRDKRRTLRLLAKTRIASAGDIHVLVRDISPGGLLIEAQAHPLTVGDRLEVALPDSQLVTAQVAWASGRFSGCTFEQLISAAAISAALLKSDPEANDQHAPIATGDELSSGGRTRLQPELTLSVAVFLSLSLWAVIAAAAYFLT